MKTKELVESMNNQIGSLKSLSEAFQSDRLASSEDAKVINGKILVYEQIVHILSNYWVRLIVKFL